MDRQFFVRDVSGLSYEQAGPMHHKPDRELNDDWVIEQLDPKLRSVVTRFNATVVDSDDY